MQVHLHYPARCLRRTDRKGTVCGADLSAAPSFDLTPEHPLIAVQHQLDALAVHGHTDPGTVFTLVDQLLTPVERSRSAQLDRISPAAHSTWEQTSNDIDDPVSQFGGWRLRERARTALTREVLHRECDENNKSLRELAVSLGLPYPIVIERAKDVGLTITSGKDPLSFDDCWLREQYIRHLRSTQEIGQSLGISGGPVKRGLAELGVALRPVGTYRRREVIARLDESLPRDVRAAVEGTTHGWLRLRRFQIHMSFPTLMTGAAYLGVTVGLLSQQLNQLEAAVGAELVHRATRRAPRRPTLRGAALLRQLEGDQDRNLIQHALGPDITPMPNTATLADTDSAFNGKRGPLTRLAAGVELPSHINVPPPLLPLLRHLCTDADPETCMTQIHTLTGMPRATVCRRLRLLEAAGWLHSRRETTNERSRRGGRGHGRLLYALTPAARRVPIHDLLN